MTPPAPRWHRPALAAGLLVVVTGCATLAPGTRVPREGAAAEEIWLVRRPAGVRAAVAGAPALAARPSGTTGTPALLELAATTIDAAVVGPLVMLTRTKRYRPPPEGADGLVVFTPPATPARQDLLLRIAGRTIRVLIRATGEDDLPAAGDRRVTELSPDADGRVVAPIGRLARGTTDLTVETVGVAAWNDGGYELTVPRVPSGDVAMTIDLYGAGPVVVVSSPSHPIDATSLAVDHLRVGVRVPIALRDADFVLRYRVDARDRPGALVACPDGSGTLVGLLLHPHEIDHQPVGLTHVRVDWGGLPVVETRPPVPRAVAAGTPLVLLTRTEGAVPKVAVVAASSGGRPRVFALEPLAAAPTAALRALPILWDRARRGLGSR